MRMMIKKLLKKYKYPPEGMEDALQTVMAQCEMWSDNEVVEYPATMREETLKVAEPEKESFDAIVKESMRTTIYNFIDKKDWK